MIALASDHAGFDYKERVKTLLDALGVSWKDYGAWSDERADYPDFAHSAALGIVSGECDRGIFICGTGIGISIAANRHNGIRASACQIPDAAEMTRRHNDSNVLCLGQRFVTWDQAENMIRIWLDTEFEGGRHTGRIEKIDL